MNVVFNSLLYLSCDLIVLNIVELRLHVPDPIQASLVYHYTSIMECTGIPTRARGAAACSCDSPGRRLIEEFRFLFSLEFNLSFTVFSNISNHITSQNYP